MKRIIAVLLTLMMALSLTTTFQTLFPCAK